MSNGWYEKGRIIVSISQQIDCSGTGGEMLATVLLGIGEMEQQVGLDRQQAGIEAAKKIKDVRIL